jgi:hypothetical protein
MIVGSSRWAHFRWVCLLCSAGLFSCFELDNQPEPIEPPESVPTHLIEQIESLQPEQFDIFAVRFEDGALRVDFRLHRHPVDPAELKKATLNALFELQTAIDKKTRLSVWCLDPVTEDFEVYAFYSPIDQSYHFRKREDSLEP